MPTKTLWIAGLLVAGLLVAGLLVAALLVAGCGERDEDESPFKTTKAPAATVSATLDSFTIRSDQAAVAHGPIRFVAKNVHARDVHELVVIRTKPDGTKQTAGEIEDLQPLASGEMVLDLPAGTYELACVIAKGEAGSSVDHYAQGMHVPFEVR